MCTTSLVVVSGVLAFVPMASWCAMLFLPFQRASHGHNFSLCGPSSGGHRWVNEIITFLQHHQWLHRRIKVIMTLGFPRGNLPVQLLDVAGGLCC